MSKQKQDKQGGGWQFPRPLEIIKCKEGNKEYMKERPARKPYGRIVKVCEFSLEAVAEFGDDDARAVWRLAKRAARDFLRVSWINSLNSSFRVLKLWQQGKNTFCILNFNTIMQEFCVKVKKSADV